MTHPLTPREKVAALKTNDPTNPAHRLASDLQAGHFAAGESRDDLIEVLSNLPRYAALVSGSGDHAELERLADRNVELSVLAYKWMEAHDALKSGQPYDYPSPADVPTLIAENAALRAERDQIAGESIWWAGVIGDGSHQPSGEVRSIKHLHPAMVKPIYEANKGTAVADVIAGLIFSLAITENREQFLVADANERRTEAERKLAEAVATLELAAIRFDEIYEAAEVDDVAYRNEATIHGINGLADVAQAEIRTFLSKEAERG